MSDPKADGGPAASGSTQAGADKKKKTPKKSKVTRVRGRRKRSSSKYKGGAMGSLGTLPRGFQLPEGGEAEIDAALQAEAEAKAAADLAERMNTLAVQSTPSPPVKKVYRKPGKGIGEDEGDDDDGDDDDDDDEEEDEMSAFEKELMAQEAAEQGDGDGEGEEDEMSAFEKELMAQEAAEQGEDGEEEDDEMSAFEKELLAQEQAEKSQ